MAKPIVGKTTAPIIPPHELFKVETTTVYLDSAGNMHRDPLSAAKSTATERVEDFLNKHTGLMPSDCADVARSIMEKSNELYDILRPYELEKEIPR